jgi:hypothetical protein
MRIMRTPAPAASGLVLAFAIASSATVAADELTAAAVAAFERYVAATEARMAGSGASVPYLWIDGLPPSRRAAIEARLTRGEIVTESPRLAGLDIPDSLFLHSLGIAFFRGATRQQTESILLDFDRHAEYFGPTVRRSRVVRRDGDSLLVARQYTRRRIVTFYYNADFAVRCWSPAGERFECRTVAVRGAQVVDAGRPTEREKPVRGAPDRQWRFHTYLRLAERPDGVLIEYESLFVSPELPLFIRFFATPIVRGLPAEAAREMLGALRARLSHS